MKYLYIFIFVFPYLLFAQDLPSEEVRIIARIKQIDQKSITLDNTNNVSTRLDDKNLQKEVSDLKAGDEALITGKIYTKSKTIEGKTVFNQVLVIESIKPISLKELGKVKLKEEDIQVKFHPHLQDSFPKTIPLSTDAANAITLTASVLLLESLSSTGNEATMRRDLNKGLIFSAGALATGLFIYEQLKGKKQK